MKRLIFQEFISLDGYAADKDHSTKFFEDKRLSQNSDEDLMEGMKNFDTILLGANTYKLFVQYWPDATTNQEVMADRLNSTSKIVFSQTLQHAPWGKWPEAKIINTDAIEAVKKLKAGDGQDMVLWGSISLAQAFIKENLIDEYHLRIVPVLLGGGKLLFTNGNELPLQLVESKTYSSGLVLLKYKPAS